MAATKRKSRAPIPYDVQVRVLFRDGWLCHWCYRPVVFPPVMRLLDQHLKSHGWRLPTAYYHPNWSRRGAPLLDHLGAVIDHVEAFAKGGKHDESNFVVACNKCNTRKNDSAAERYQEASPGRRVKGKYGEPEHWDGLASLFVVLADGGATLEPSEERWLDVLRSHFAGPDSAGSGTGEG